MNQDILVKARQILFDWKVVSFVHEHKRYPSDSDEQLIQNSMSAEELADVILAIEESYE